jgi:predicted peroxiredoxin
MRTVRPEASDWRVVGRIDCPNAREGSLMARILYSSTYGSDDPTRASLPFHMAMGAIEAGHEPEIALIAEATYLMKDTVADTIQGVGMPSLKDLLAHAVEHKVPIHV